MGSAKAAEGRLPEGFADLEHLLTEWNLATEEARYAKRLSLTLAQLRLFHEAIAPRMDAMMQHPAGFPADDLAALPAPTRNLYRLALGYFEASHPIELHWKAVDLAAAFPAECIVYLNPSKLEN